MKLALFQTALLVVAVQAIDLAGHHVKHAPAKAASAKAAPAKAAPAKAAPAKAAPVKDGVDFGCGCPKCVDKVMTTIAAKPAGPVKEHMAKQTVQHKWTNSASPHPDKYMKATDTSCLEAKVKAAKLAAAGPHDCKNIIPPAPTPAPTPASAPAPTPASAAPAVAAISA